MLERVRGAEDDGVITSNGDGFDQVGNCVKGNESLDVDLLDDLDSYMEDINDRLTISRMVSDSVIKGMVNAFEQEAAEKIAAKEFEVARFKESLCFRHTGKDETGLSRLSVIGHESESIGSGECLSFVNACVKHDKMRESLHLLRKAAKEQFSTLKKEIGGIRGGCSLQRAGSGSGLVGLSGILKENETESWTGVDRTVDSLEMTMNSVCTKVDDMLQLSKASLCEWKQEQDFKGELEAMVMQSSIRSLQEEFEAKMWDQQACLSDSKTVNWLEKFNEISGLRKELDAFIKLLPSPPDPSQLVSHGSIDLDHSHGVTGNHLSPQTPRWEGNGKADESKTSVPENFDAAQLNHLKREDLVNYFNTAILKMKREHESEVQEITEKYFFLKGKYLNERRSVLPLTKGKEFDVLRKKIPEVILKLDDILVESEKLPTFGGNADTLGSLRDRLDSLLAENRQLRDSLTEKKHEVKCLSSQVSDASGKMLQYSSIEANLHKLIENLGSSLEDARLEAAITEEVYTCVLGELRNQIICTIDESGLQLGRMQDMYGAILKEATVGVKSTSKCEIEDADIEPLIKQGLYESILLETLKDAEHKFEELFEKYSTADQNQVSLEMKAMEKEIELRLEVEEKEKLRQELNLLSNIVEEKERLAMEASAALTKERQQVEQASEELKSLREHAILQQTLMSNTNRELDMMKGDLVEARGRIEVDQMEIRSLNEKLEGVMEELIEAGAQRNLVLALTQEKENYLSLFEAKEKEHKKQIEAVIPLVEGLSEKIANLECRVAGDMKMNNLRLENSSSQLRSLIKKANVLRRTEFHYKQRLEKRCSDLQMAEAEVDLLGDEVDTLLNLLEKIYVALEHYSPVLQHYPGVIEILKLVRRELSGEPIKPV